MSSKNISRSEILHQISLLKENIQVTPSTPTLIPAPTSFLFFPLLPPELRLKIFSHACHITRNVTLEIDTSTANHQNVNILLPRYHTSTPVPSILQVNREAREQALKHYALSFSTTFDISTAAHTRTFSSPAKIYINWEYDRLVFMRPLQFWQIIGAMQTQAHLSAFITDLQSLCRRNKLRRIGWNSGAVAETYLYLGLDIDPADEETRVAVLANLDFDDVVCFCIDFPEVTAETPSLQALQGKVELGFVGEDPRLHKGYPHWEWVDGDKLGIADYGVDAAGLAVLTGATIGVVDEKGVVDINPMALIGEIMVYGKLEDPDKMDVFVTSGILAEVHCEINYPGCSRYTQS
jgi:hypothetical protein